MMTGLVLCMSAIYNRGEYFSFLMLCNISWVTAESSLNYDNYR